MNQSPPPSKPILFISHSLHDSDKASWLDEIYNELTNKQLFAEVIIDQSWLNPGDDWRKKLITWGLNACHGAVLLVNERAVKKSSWVPVEATLLRNRCWMPHADFPFKMIGVEELDGETLSHLNKGMWEPLAFAENQMAKAFTVARVVEEIEDMFLQWQYAETPFENLAFRLAKDLKELGLPACQQIIDACKNHLAEDGRELASYLEHHQRAAVGICLAGLEPFPQIIRIIFNACSLSAKLDYCKIIRALVSVLTPRWIEHHSVASLKQLSLKHYKGPRHFCVWTADADFALPCYVRRGSDDYEEPLEFNINQPPSLSPIQWQVLQFSLDGPADDVDTLIEKLTDHLGEKLTVEGLRPVSGKNSVNRNLKNEMKPGGHPVVMVIAEHMVEQPGFLEAIHQEFPYLIVAVITEGEDDYVLQPLEIIDEDEQDEAYQWYEDAVKALLARI